MKLPHTAGPYVRDNNPNVEFHKVLEDDQRRQTDSPLIFFPTTTNKHFSPLFRQV